MQFNQIEVDFLGGCDVVCDKLEVRKKNNAYVIFYWFQ
jgi:hypothetical protein